jgi:hypothetical protein
MIGGKIDDMEIRDKLPNPLPKRTEPMKPVEELVKLPEINFNFSDRWNQFVGWFKKSITPIMNNIITTAIKAIIPSWIGWAIGAIIVIGLIVFLIKMIG